MHDENDADSFTFGLKLKNGTTLWKKPPRGANWASPVTLKSSVQWVGLQSKEGLAFLNPSNGEILELRRRCIHNPSSVISSNNVVLIPSNGLTALEEPVAGKTPIMETIN